MCPSTPSASTDLPCDQNALGVVCSAVALTHLQINRRVSSHFLYLSLYLSEIIVRASYLRLLNISPLQNITNALIHIRGAELGLKYHLASSVMDTR